MYRLQHTVDNEVTLLQVLDTAGQEEFYALRDSWFRAGDCFLMVFSFTSRKSFEEVSKYYEAMCRVKDADHGTVPVVLVGNKVDLEDEFEVSFEEAARKAEEFDCPLMCASAKTNTNVTESYYELVRQDRKKRGKQPAAGPIVPRRANLAKFKGMCPIL